MIEAWLVLAAVGFLGAVVCVFKLGYWYGRERGREEGWEAGNDAANWRGGHW